MYIKPCHLVLHHNVDEIPTHFFAIALWTQQYSFVTNNESCLDISFLMHKVKNLKACVTILPHTCICTILYYRLTNIYIVTLHLNIIPTDLDSMQVQNDGTAYYVEVIFGTGETESCIRDLIVDDMDVEEIESFSIQWGNTAELIDSGSTVPASPGMATIQIQDNDVARKAYAHTLYSQAYKNIKPGIH